MARPLRLPIPGGLYRVFEARFGATLVEEDGYFLEVPRYIVLNPVRAGIVDHPPRTH